APVAPEVTALGLLEPATSPEVAGSLPHARQSVAIEERAYATRRRDRTRSGRLRHAGEASCMTWFLSWHRAPPPRAATDAPSLPIDRSARQISVAAPSTVREAVEPLWVFAQGLCANRSGFFSLRPRRHGPLRWQSQ